MAFSRQAMALSSLLPLYCLLVALSAAALLPTDPNASVQKGVDVTPDSRLLGQLPNTTDEPPDTVRGPATARPMNVISGPTTPVKLTCPRENPNHYIATVWYVFQGTSRYRLYRTDKRRGVTEYARHPDLEIARLNVTDEYSLTIYDDACNHTGIYQCVRVAHVGFRIKEYTFHLDNCTVINKTLGEKALTLGNSAPDPISSPTILGRNSAPDQISTSSLTITAAAALVHFFMSSY